MKRVFAGLVLLAILLPAVPGRGQILNTLSGFENRRGWQGEASGFVDVSGGNTDLQEYLTSAVGQWQGAIHRVRLIAAYDFARGPDGELKNDLRAHLRHNRRLGRGFSSLLFTQYQRNPFQRLDARILAGAGARLDLVEAPERRFAIGAAAMYESDERSGADRVETARLSVFVDFGRDLKEYLRVGFVCFYQPAFDDFGDARASAIGDLDFDLAGPLSLVVAASINHDPRPPDGVEETDWNLRTGLRLKL